MAKKTSNQNPIDFFKNLSRKEKNVCFLHSHTKNGWGSIIAYSPIEKFKGTIENAETFIKKNTKKNRLIVGYFSYDIGYKLYKIKRTAKNDLNLPEIYLLAFDSWTEFKNFKLKKEKFQTKKSGNFSQIISKSNYSKSFKKIKHHLKEGDIYQINYTHRLEAETKQNPRDLFLDILEKNKVDHLAYIEGDGFEILSASPERFIKIKNRKIETCPIKGTRPRGKTPTEDKKFKKELIESEKEAAELNMITDLLRNDMGKVCEIGSVKLEGRRLISKCPTVWHTYSKITGKIQKNLTPINAMLSMLPGGSITGCPKKRAMEIIDELEPNTRGVYTGVIGFIKPNNDMDFNIAIRTVIKKGKKLYLQVGGGIVIDSNENAEYKETLEKAKSFLWI